MSRRRCNTAAASSYLDVLDFPCLLTAVRIADVVSPQGDSFLIPVSLLEKANIINLQEPATLYVPVPSGRFFDVNRRR